MTTPTSDRWIRPRLVQRDPRTFTRLAANAHYQTKRSTTGS